jgi:hypothetical protein
MPLVSTYSCNSYNVKESVVKQQNLNWEIKLEIKLFVQRFEPRTLRKNTLSQVIQDIILEG